LLPRSRNDGLRKRQRRRSNGATGAARGTSRGVALGWVAAYRYVDLTGFFKWSERAREVRAVHGLSRTMGSHIPADWARNSALPMSSSNRSNSHVTVGRAFA